MPATVAPNFADPEVRLKMVQDIQKGVIPQDWVFDQVYPAWVRKLSHVHWTPIKVAYKAAQLLKSRSTLRILDLGSGAGKFCLLGAISTKNIFVGVDKNAGLCTVAQETSRLFELNNAEFIVSDMFKLDWTTFNGIYLFNPFHELVATHAKKENFGLIYKDYVDQCEEKLSNLRTNTKVVTYFGYGKKMPANFSLMAEEDLQGGKLQLWKKRY